MVVATMPKKGTTYKKYTPEQIAAVITAARAGATPKDVEAQTGVSWMVCRYHMKKAGLHQDRPPVVDEARLAEMTRRGQAGETTQDIAVSMGLDRSLVAHHLKRAGAYVLKGPARKYTDEQKTEVLRLKEVGTSIDGIATATGVDTGSVRSFTAAASVFLTPSQHARLCRTVITDEIEEEITRLRAEGRTREQIEEELSLAAGTLKSHLTRNGDVLPMEVRTANVQAGKADFYENYEKVVLPAIAAEHGGRMLGPYEGTRSPVTKWACKYGHEFNMRPNYVQQGNWCPQCANKSSRGERAVLEFVQSLCPDAIGRKRGLLGPGDRRELDVWVPSVRFGLEFDGLYWHSEAAPGEYRSGRARDKALAAQAAGIKYFAIFEDEWRDKRALVEAMIRLRVGRFEGERLNARDLEVTRLDKNAEFGPFFEQSHLAGQAGRASYAYALIHKGWIVAAMSMRTNWQKEKEIARFAVAPGFLVRGAAGRLLASVRREERCQIVSYSDNRLSSGGIYQRLGFREETESRAPNYWYTDFASRVSRHLCKKNNDPAICAQFKTEARQAAGGVFSEPVFGDDRSLYRIEDAGSRRWVLA